MWLAGSLAAEVADLPGGEVLARQVAALEAVVAPDGAPAHSDLTALASCGACDGCWPLEDVTDDDGCPNCGALRHLAFESL